MEICNHFDYLEEVVERDYRVEEHEEGLGHSKDIGHWPRSPGFEVAHTIISNVAYRAASQGREYEAGY